MDGKKYIGKAKQYDEDNNLLILEFEYFGKGTSICVNCVITQIFV